jgi:hypothetical protein
MPSTREIFSHELRSGFTPILLAQFAHLSQSLPQADLYGFLMKT